MVCFVVFFFSVPEFLDGFASLGTWPMAVEGLLGVPGALVVYS